MILLNSMVRLKINNDNWVGQVVDIVDDGYLIQLIHNMHYWAKEEELSLLCPKGIA